MDIYDLKIELRWKTDIKVLDNRNNIDLDTILLDLTKYDFDIDDNNILDRPIIKKDSSLHDIIEQLWDFIMIKKIPKNCYLLLKFSKNDDLYNIKPHINIYIDIVRNPGIRYFNLKDFNFSFTLKQEILSDNDNNVSYYVPDALILEEWKKYNSRTLQIKTTKNSNLLHNIVYKDVKEITLCSSKNLIHTKNKYKKTYTFNQDLTLFKLISTIDDFETEFRAKFEIESKNIKFNGLKKITPKLYMIYWRCG